MGSPSEKAGAGSLLVRGAPPNYRGRVCGRPIFVANLGIWEPGLDRLDDLTPEDLCVAPLHPVMGVLGLRYSFSSYASSPVLFLSHCR